MMMLWRDIFNTLIQEGTMMISTDATITAELASMIGDIPIYKFKLQYFREGVDELLTEYAETFEELQNIIEREVAFRRCDECGKLIVGALFINKELGKDYCCLKCLVDDMNETYGKGNWRFKDNGSPFPENDDDLLDEYQYEILVDAVDEDLSEFMNEVEEAFDNMGLGDTEPDEEETDPEELEFCFDEPDIEEVDTEELTESEFCFDEPDKVWRPYHMYFCPSMHSFITS